MAKKDNANELSVSAQAAEGEAHDAPSENQVSEILKGAETSQEAAAEPEVSPRRFRNVSATLLTKDDSSPFPRGTVSVLTEAEITRFQQAKQHTGQTFIVEVK